MSEGISIWPGDGDEARRKGAVREERGSEEGKGRGSEEGKGRGGAVRKGRGGVVRTRGRKQGQNKLSS